MCYPTIFRKTESLGLSSWFFNFGTTLLKPQLPFHLFNFFLSPLLISMLATWVPILPVNDHQKKTDQFLIIFNFSGR
jgi:hypothetical protein